MINELLWWRPGLNSMYILFVFATKLVFKNPCLYVRKALVVPDSHLLVDPQHDFIERCGITVLMLVSNALFKIIRQNVDEHLAEVVIWDPQAVSVSIRDPLGNVIGKVLPIFALWESMKFANVL